MQNSRSRMVQAILVAVSLLGAAALRAQTAPVAQRITQAVNNQNLVTLRGNVHPLAQARFDRGPAPDTMQAPRMLLVLQRPPQQQAALDKFLVEQQSKSSPNFHQWLTPEQFGARFGPSAADIQTVTNWLTSEGFQVNQVSKGRAVIEFSGTAGQVRTAFHTQIHQYVVDGKTRWANSTDPKIPAALAPVIAGIDSLNNFPRKPQLQRLGTFTHSKATGETRPLFFYPAGTTGHYIGMGPGDFATIYNVLPLWTASTPIDGTGQDIAVVAETNINCQDVADFRTMFGLPYTPSATDPPCPSNFQRILNGPDPGIPDTGEEGEADLDAQWAGAIAKNATVKFVISETPTTIGAAGVDLSALYIVDNNLAGVLTDSYGQCEAFLGTSGNQFYYSIWEQAAAEGITVVVASGDSGSAGCDNPNTEVAAGDPTFWDTLGTQGVQPVGIAVSGIASTPYNVAIGGTDYDFTSALNLTDYWNTTNTAANTSTTGTTGMSAKSYIPETTWNDSCAQTGASIPCTDSSFQPDSGGGDLVAGSGGPSNCTSSTVGISSILCTAHYAKPAWQTGTGVPNDGARDLPDVSLFAGDGYNGTFYIFCQADQNTGTGSSTTSCDLNSPYTNFQGGGGTSFGAPAFGSIMALVNQKAGGRQGNANFVLYKLAAQTGASCTSNSAAVTNSNCIFYDTATGNNSVACVGGTAGCSKTTSGGYGFLASNAGSASPTPAFPTTAAYDQATGLGTVNVANLVNNWNTVSFTGTSTTLSLSPTTLTHGASVTVNIGVTPSSATGDVALIASQSTDPNLDSSNVGTFTLSGGAVSSNTTLLPGGTYDVVAHYYGNGTYGASDSAPVSVTVSKESSKTAINLMVFSGCAPSQISCSGTSTPYGSPYVLRVDVTNSAGQQCSSTSGIPCPSGTVTVTDNGSPLDDFIESSNGTTTLNEQGFLEDQPVQLPAGNHQLVAAYAGDNSYTSSTSPTNPISITKAATSTTVAASPSTNVSAGDNVTLTATVSTQSNSDVPPSGTVTFYNGSTAITGTPTYQGIPYNTSTGAYAEYQATLITSFQSSASITAKYNGDTNYLASAASPAVSVSVTATPADFTLTANPMSITIASAGQSGTSTITATTANQIAGTVNFACTPPASSYEITCAMSPTSAQITSTQNATSTLTVTTTAAHTVSGLAPGPKWFLPAAGSALLCLLALLLFDPRRRRKIAYGVASLGLLAALSVACGGGGTTPTIGRTDPGTPAGTYTVTVTGTSGTNVHTATVTVTVQ